MAEEKSARAMGWIALGFLLFFEAAVESNLPRGRCAALLFSLLPALGLRLCLRNLPAFPEQAPAPLRLACLIPLSLGLLLLTARAADALARVAAYAALARVPGWLRIAIVLSAAGGCACFGLPAVASAARLRLPLLTALILAILLAQLPVLQPRWMLPALTRDVRGLGLASLRLGAVQVLLLSALWLMCGKGAARPAHLRAVLSALAALALIAMMAPAMPLAPDSRLFRLDLLLSNGRASLTLQLAFILLFFVGLMTAVCACLALFARAAQLAAPRLGQRQAVLLGALPAGLVMRFAPVLIAPATVCCALAVLAPLCVLSLRGSRKAGGAA